MSALFSSIAHWFEEEFSKITEHNLLYSTWYGSGIEDEQESISSLPKLKSEVFP